MESIHSSLYRPVPSYRRRAASLAPCASRQPCWHPPEDRSPSGPDMQLRMSSPSNSAFKHNAPICSGICDLSASQTGRISYPPTPRRCGRLCVDRHRVARCEELAYGRRVAGQIALPQPLAQEDGMLPQQCCGSGGRHNVYCYLRAVDRHVAPDRVREHYGRGGAAVDGWAL